VSAQAEDYRHEAVLRWAHANGCPEYDPDEFG
jgi:hypothetical protein